MRTGTLLITLLAACAGTSNDPNTPQDPQADPLPWAVADCDLDPAGTGWDEGDVLPDFSLTNQLGSQTSLHQFCDRYILVQVTNFW